MNATPRPWHAEHGIGISEIVSYQHGTPITIASTPRNDEPMERQANAALIVTAVNSHAALLTFAKAFVHNAVCLDPNPVLENLVLLAEATIAAAKVKQP